MCCRKHCRNGIRDHYRYYTYEHASSSDLVWAVETGHGLRQAHHALQLPHRDSPSRFGRAASVSLTQSLVLLHDKLLGFWGDLENAWHYGRVNAKISALCELLEWCTDLWLKLSGKQYISLDVFRSVDTFYRLHIPGMEVDNPPGYGVIGHLKTATL